jgi:hypothetical protein
LGIIAYYAGTFLGGIILGLIAVLMESNFTETMPNIVLSLISMPLGLLACWGLYKFLEHQWSKIETLNNNTSLDGNLME